MSSSDTNIVWHHSSVSHEDRVRLKQHSPAVLWFTGMSGSGKSTIANAVEYQLIKLGKHSYLLDGDNIRHGLNHDLGFSDEARKENIRRIGEVSKLFVDAGLIVLTAFISPFAADRRDVRSLFKDGEFLEIYIDTPLEVCEKRDPKGLYKKAREGVIPDFTGIHSVYEAPIAPDIHLQTMGKSVDECVQIIIDKLDERGILSPKEAGHAL